MRQILVLFSFLMLSAVNTFASESPYLVNVDIETKIMVVDLSQTTGKDVSVSIVDLNGNTIFSESLNNKAKSRRYNLSKLPTGTYTVIVEDLNKVSYQKVYVSKKSLLADDNIEEITMPTMINNGNKWSVSGLNTKYNGRIIIFDEDGNEIFTENISKAMTSRSFNVEKLNAGLYSVHYVVNGKTFAQSLKK